MEGHGPQSGRQLAGAYVVLEDGRRGPAAVSWTTEMVGYVTSLKAKEVTGRPTRCGARSLPTSPGR